MYFKTIHETLIYFVFAWAILKPPIRRLIGLGLQALWQALLKRWLVRLANVPANRGGLLTSNKLP
ncbi:hypothetical protein FH5T_19860 [Draconibacterium orientale]|uniref:Uncharacterized protein n=1 Tax=Draconibacterium orientale TaxID=1168034 RepID=A0ABN4D4W9_9BACT|nr:hypothetical protein FH5T_19860 [Draconibacterium orientale]